MNEEREPTQAREIPDGESYEELVARLEDSVSRLESGDLSMEEAVLEYEFGMKVIELCNEMLDKAELRVTELSNRATASAGFDAEDDEE